MDLKVGVNLNLVDQNKNTIDSVTVKKLIGQGGQGYVYEVTLASNKKTMALKWYKKNMFTKSDVLKKFWENMFHNISQGSPSEIFLWPKYITDIHDGVFGYVMDYRPKGYYDFADYLLCKKTLKSFRHILVAAVDICNAFSKLHSQGKSYQDISSGNFFINEDNGHVIVADNDNVFPQGEQSGIWGTMQYIAPEVVVGKEFPNTYSDRFSLSVVLFMLFYMNHPFEGKRFFDSPCITPEVERKIYGSDILFIFDPTNKSNAPIPGVHKNVLSRWPILPSILRDAFVHEFSQAILQSPQNRMVEIQWLKLFEQVRDCLVVCPHCKKETILQPEVGNTQKCLMCKKQYPVPHVLRYSRRTMPLVQNNLLYFDRDDKADIGIIPDKQFPSESWMKNLTNNKWLVKTPKGNIKPIEPGEVLPIKTGLKISFDNTNQFNAEIF